MPVILLSQLSRDNVKDPNGARPPELSDLRGSGALEQDATSVVLMHKVAEVNTAWRNEPPLYFVEPTEDPRLNNERAGSIAAVNWNLAKNQNGPTGEIPFVVFQNCFRWYVGNDDADKVEKFYKIQADWRFLEEPFLTAEKNGAVVYPDFWAQKCAEMCGKLGLAIPSNIKDQLKSWDIERYESLIKEHNSRMANVRETSATPIKVEEAPPSIVAMNATTQIKKEETVDNSSAELDRKLNEKTPSNTESDIGREPLPEDGYDDDDF